MADEPDTTRRSTLDLTPSIVAQLRRGNNDAASLLEAAYRIPIVRFCRGYLDTIEDAEDAAQEIFCKVLAAREVPDNFRAWLYRIARNHCLNALRSRHRRRDRDALKSALEPEIAWTGELTRLANREMRRRIHEQLEALSPQYREVLRLRYAQGLSRAEIAEVLDIRESLVKTRLFEGLRLLRRGLASQTGRSDSSGR